MLELFFGVFTLALATLWTVELLDTVFYRWLARWIFIKALPVPVAAGYGWLLGFREWSLLVLAIASASAVLIFLKWLEPPIVLPPQFRR